MPAKPPSRTERRIIAGRFELVDIIGRGAMGVVWSAIDRETRAHVAVKIAQRWTDQSPELLARFKRESKILKRLKSPFICGLVAAGDIDERVPFIVLERCVGETLETHLSREGTLPLDEAAAIADELLQALVVAHAAGVVHRDLSPANVFLHRERDGRVVSKILDFGIAKAENEGGVTPLTADKTMMGSLPYVAPEQLGDSARAGPRADLYGVGAILFRALSGELPHGSARGMRLVVLKREHEARTIDEATGMKWPAELRIFLSKCIARNPARRYPSAQVALASLRHACRGPTPLLELPDPPSSRPQTVTLRETGPRGRR